MRIRFRFKSLDAIVCAALGLAFSSPAIAQDDGARLYMMVPEGTTIASLRVHHLSSNVGPDDSTVAPDKLETNLAVFQFVQALKLGSDQGFVFLVVPASHIGTDANPPGTPDSISGLGDVQLGFVLGIHGTPALAPADYDRHKPGLAANLLAKIFFPTGKYSRDRSINIGANHWALRLGVPLVYAIGERMADPHLTTIELMPTLTLYGANDDPFNAERTQQKPLLIVEGHATHAFSRSLWGSIDLLWRRGGEVAVNGGEPGNYQRALSLGATGVFALSRSASLRLSYGQVVDRNAFGPNGSMLRAVIGFVF